MRRVLVRSGRIALSVFSAIERTPGQLTATPMANLLRARDTNERENVIGAVAADTQSMVDPQWLHGERFSFPQECFVTTASRS
jgi:hypothetical protein